MPFTSLRQLAPAIGRRHFTGRVGRRLLLWLLAFSLIPLLLSTTVGYLESKDIIQRLVYRYLSAIAEVQARHVADQVERHLISLELITAGNRFLAAGATVLGGGDAGDMTNVADAAAVADYLDRKLGDLPAFDGLYLQAPGGAVLASASNRLATTPLPRPPAGSGRYFDVLSAADGTPPRFRMSVPVRDPAGRPTAYLTGTISLRGLRVFLEIPERLAGTIESYVIDLNRQPLFISNPRGQIAYGKPLIAAAAFHGVAQRASYRNENGIDVLATAVAVPGLSWFYVTEVPLADALGPLRSLRTVSVVFEGALAVLILVGAWLVARGIVAPVRKLVEAARRVAGGQLDVKVPTRGNDELTELGQTFNEMTRELVATSTRVRELHQREIERAQQLATVGELASGVAHEIKNPLVGVSNGLDLVRRRMGAEHPELSPILEEMARQLTRMESAIRDLLAFARPATPSVAPAEANQIARRALRLVEPAAQNQGVEITYRADPTGAELCVDHELIEQALVNLLMNAVQATPPTGHVVVSAQAVNGEVHFHIADSGRGITPADLEHIFKPFFTTKHSGTGLGLSITHDIVERHGGRIEVETQVGRGSTFSLVLPALQPQVAHLAMQEASA